MTRNVWIIVSLVGVAALLWIVASSKSGGDRPGSPDPSAYGAPVGGMQLADEAAEPDPEPAPAEPLAEAPAEPPTEPAAAVEPSAPAAPAASPRPPPSPTTNLPPPERTGPVDALKARFASDPRDASAGAFEKEIEAAFDSSDVPAALLRSVTCRATVCRVETRWAAERAIGFMSAFTRLLMLSPDDPTPRLFDTNLAISPEGAPDASGVHAVEVYIARLPPAEPSR